MKSSHNITQHLSIDQIKHSYLAHINASTSSPVGDGPVSKPLRQREYYRDGYLTARESECIKLLILNKKLIEIAEELGLSKRTVEFYMKNVRTRFDLRKKAEMITYFKDLA